MNKAIKIIASGLIAAPIALGLFLGSSLIHLQIYKAINPTKDTEYGHNYYFDQQLEIHFYIAIPVFFVASSWLIYRLFKRGLKNYA